MKIRFEKKGGMFTVSTPDLTGVGGKGKDTEDAIVNFNDSIDRIYHQLNALGCKNTKCLKALIIDEVYLNNNHEFHFDEASWDDFINISFVPDSKSKALLSVGNINIRGNKINPYLLDAGHEKLSGDILEKDLSKADPSNPFYDKRIVFTGIISAVSRNDAAVRVKEMGADINTSISKLTDIVIMGDNAGPSKLKKIEEYNNAGSNIRIIEESEFLELIKV